MFKSMVSLALASAIFIQADRFDMRVREDFFAGLAGDKAAMTRAMKLCEDRLKENPKDAEAMVWHGSGLAFGSGELFQKGDFSGGAQMRQRGIKEMDDAVNLQPGVSTWIPRGSSLRLGSQFANDPAIAE